MHSSLSRLQYLLAELGAEDLIDEVRLSALVTLMVENLFSIMRQDNPMPTQLEYGIRRAACVRELEKRMYRGHFHYFTGPKSYYPDKVMNSAPPPKPPVSLVKDGIARLTIDETMKQESWETLLHLLEVFGNILSGIRAKKTLAIYLTLYPFHCNNVSQVAMLQLASWWRVKMQYISKIESFPLIDPYGNVKFSSR